MRKFCKLFEFDDIGQVLVVNDNNDDGNPSVSFKFTPEGFGICGPSFSWKSSEKGYQQCDEYFDKVTKESAREAVMKVLNMMQESR